MTAAIDMAGRVCGQLTVIGPVPTQGRRAMWRCLCFCGNETIVRGKYLRSGHTKTCGCMRRPAVDRFAEKVALTDSGCIEWIGSLHHGYGQFRPDGAVTGDSLVRAHRWSYEYHVGPIPEGLMILHSCDNPACVNPQHLRPGTGSDNMRDAVERRRHHHARKTHCKHGHEFTPENTITFSKGYRRCRECKNAQKRDQRASRKEAA